MTISFNTSQKHQKLFSHSPQEGVMEGEKNMVFKTQQSSQPQPAQQSKSVDWQEVVVGNVFSFQQVGDTIEGVLVAKRQGKMYDTGVYDIQTKEGIRTVFGTAILDTRMERVEENHPIKIEFVGEVKTGTGRLAKNFKVYTK